MSTFISYATCECEKPTCADFRPEWTESDSKLGLSEKWKRKLTSLNIKVGAKVFQERPR